jgi:AraC-like DNA-binding protein/ligand-binding sensor protein
MADRSTENRKTLERFLDELARITGLRVCLYDMSVFAADRTDVLASNALRHHRCSLCSLMKTKQDALDRCIAHDRLRARRAWDKGKPIIDTCHAGVTDLITPITIAGQAPGVLFLGQTVTIPSPQLETKLKRLAHDFGFTHRQLNEAKQKMSQRTRKDIGSHRSLLKLITQFVAQQEHIRQLELELANWQPDRTTPLTPRQALDQGKIPTPLVDRLIQSLDIDRQTPVHDCLLLIKERYCAGITLQDAAHALHISSSHLSRLFSQTTGISFRSCLLETRLNAGLNLVRRFHISITQATELLGYDDPSIYLRSFKRKTGMTPGQFLREYPQDSEHFES